MELSQIDSETSRAFSARESGSPSRSGIRRLLIMLTLLAIVGTAAFYVRSGQHRQLDVPLSKVDQSDVRDLELTELSLSLSLLSQQLNELFRMFLHRVSVEEALAPDDQLMLEVWLQFDERFIEKLQDFETLKYERVAANLRVGHGLQLLEMPESAIPHFESAIELLTDLIKQDPLIASYRLDQSDAYYGLARSMRLIGRPREALTAIDAAIGVLNDSRSPAGIGREERLIELYRQKRELLTPNHSAQ